MKYEYVPNLAEETVADRLSRPFPALLLLLDIIDVGAGEEEIIIRWDITRVGGVFSNSPVLGMILFGPFAVVLTYNNDKYADQRLCLRSAFMDVTSFNNQ